jgi:hypothetical protein
MAGSSDGSFASSGLWLLKLDASGNTSWQQTYVPGTTSVAYSVQETLDGGYVVAGAAVTYDKIDYDFWVLKTDEFGNIEWQYTYGGSLEERAFSVYPTLDMGYIVAGFVELEGDNYDAWVVKLDEMGFVSWEKRYGGSDAGSYSVRETSDGGYILAGYIKLETGGDDFWVVKLDEDGTLSWEKAYVPSVRAATTHGCSSLTKTATSAPKEPGRKPMEARTGTSVILSGRLQTAAT